MSPQIGPRTPCRFSIPPSVWTADIGSAELDFSDGVGVADGELIEVLRPVLIETLTDGPQLSCIVSHRIVPELNEAVVALLGNVDPVVSERLKDVVPWVQSKTEPVLIVVYLSLWSRGVNATQLATLKETVPEGSRLVFVEPTLAAGGWAIVQRFAKSVFRKRLGLSFHRDIPALVREAGWQLTTVNRVSVGAPSGLMTFVVGEARLYR